MNYQFTISDIGLRLIKAYEGFRSNPRTLTSGGQVIGFGHTMSEDEDLKDLTEEDAEDLLKTDLLPIEDLINTHVHASMTQSQFDALCSLAFSIGPDAFMSSNIIHAMNRGQIIEAANGFDIWRKGNINGQIYVVDALVRRRTAEKALFLRPTQRTARAPRFELTAIMDTAVPAPKAIVEHTHVTPDMMAETAIEAALPHVDIPESEGEADLRPFDLDLADDGMDISSRRNLSAAAGSVLYHEDPDSTEDALKQEVEDIIHAALDPTDSYDHDPDNEITPEIRDLDDSTEIMELDMVAAPPTGALAETFQDTNITASLEEDTASDGVNSDVESALDSDTDLHSDGDNIFQIGGDADVDNAMEAIESTPQEPTENEIVITSDEDHPAALLNDQDASAEIETNIVSNTENDTETDEDNMSVTQSPIAAAAAEVSDRLDALIDEPAESEVDWPESLISASEEPKNDAPAPQNAGLVIDELQRDDALRDQEARASQFNADRYIEYAAGGATSARNNLWAFVAMMIIGLSVCLAGLGINMKGATIVLGENGPFIAVSCILIGMLLFVGGAFYMMKSVFARS